MKRTRSLLTAILLAALPACSTAPTPPLQSPSGRYSVSYVKQGSDEYEVEDASYTIADGQSSRCYSVSTGEDTELKNNSIIWSPSENAFVIRQSDLGVNRRIVLVIWNPQARRFTHHVIAMGPLERLYFHHCKTTVVGLSDQSVFFKTKRAAGTTEFSFSDLIKESQRQDP